MSEQDINAVADALFGGIENGDVDAVRAIYSDDAVIWHNNDEIEQTPAENLVVLQWIINNLADRKYEDIRRTITADGFVQQHVMRFTRKDGTRQEIPACLVVAVSDGHITRIDEYLDSAHISRITG